ncbi:MAG: S24/S26 family peptidase [Myxococcota bacterium]
MRSGIDARLDIRALTPEHVEWLEELLDEGYTVRVRATGPSMRPFILSGEWIWLRRIPERPTVGDVVMVLEHGRRLLVHRVTRLSDSGVQTQGDSAHRPDAWVPLERVVGRVVRVESMSRSWLAATFRALVLGRVSRLLRWRHSAAGQLRRSE